MISRTIIFLHSFTMNFCYGGLNSVKLSLQKVITEMFIVSISVLKNLVEKNDISGFIWYVHSNDKMLFFQPKDYLQRAALVKLFFLEGKVCVLYPCVGKSLAWCLSFEAFQRPCRKNYISAHISHKPFIQTVNTLLLTKGLFIKVSMARCSR